MKIGTIIENTWASHDNPIRFSVYIGNSQLLYITDGKAHVIHNTGLVKDKHYREVGFIYFEKAINDAKEKQLSLLNELLNRKVTELCLSVRTTNICLTRGCNTVRDICRLTSAEWLKYIDGGKRSLKEIEDFLEENGLGWGMNV